MRSMVECVARIICAAAFEDPDGDYGATLRWRAHEETARRVILAMREPTGAMVGAGAASEDAMMGSAEHSALHTYYAMIDAAHTEE